MSLFKTGDAMHDQYAGYSTEQLIQIVTDKNESYAPGVVETARRILLARGHDYRTKEQKAAEKQLQTINRTRENTAAASQVRPYQQRTPAKGSSLKPWHWILIIYFIVRAVGCLAKMGH